MNLMDVVRDAQRCPDCAGKPSVSKVDDVWVAYCRRCERHKGKRYVTAVEAVKGWNRGDECPSTTEDEE